MDGIRLQNGPNTNGLDEMMLLASMQFELKQAYAGSEMTKPGKLRNIYNLLYYIFNSILGEGVPWLYNGQVGVLPDDRCPTCRLSILLIFCIIVVCLGNTRSCISPAAYCVLDKRTYFVSTSNQHV